MKQQQRQTPESSMFEESIIVACVLLALCALVWTALLIAFLVHLCTRNRVQQPLLWLVMFLLGIGGGWLWFMVFHTLPYITSTIDDVVRMIQHSNIQGWRIVHDLVPIWMRSLLLFPLCVLVIDLLRPISLETRLRQRSQQQQAIRKQQSQRARRNVRTCPEIRKGKAVLGIVIPSHTKEL